MQKIRKILRVVSEKTELPTNQLLPTTPILYDLADAEPIITNNTDLKGRRWRQSKNGNLLQYVLFCFPW